MSMERVRQAVLRANSVLELKRKIVGVKFLFKPQEFEQADAIGFKKPIRYCSMVKAATAGHAVKAAAEHFGCPGGSQALGISENDELYRSGHCYLELGLFRDLTIAKNAINNMTFCQHKLYGVMVKPLGEFDSEPDVVIIVAASYAAMRIVQGYTYSFGMQTAFKLSGNQAICSECTAYPFETNNINISLLCSGTRNFAGWDEDELGIGLPFNRFVALVEGVYSTVNAAEPNKKKKQIKEKLKQNNLHDLNVEYDTAYFSRRRATDPPSPAAG